MILAAARTDEAPALAATHGRSFDTPWDARDIETLMNAPGGFAVLARSEPGASPVAGFLLARAIAGEAEILTLAVDPTHRRQGLARALIEAATAIAASTGAETMFLEVAADNTPAIGLYARAGFEQVGARRGYYARAGEAPMDALVLRRALTPPT